METGGGCAVACAALAILRVCNGAVGGRAVDWGSFVAGVGGAYAVEAGTCCTSDIPADTGSIVGSGTVRVGAVGGGHAETVVGFLPAWPWGGGDSVVFQMGRLRVPGASWCLARGRNFNRLRVTQSETCRCRLARRFVRNGYTSSAHVQTLLTGSLRITKRTHVVLSA